MLQANVSLILPAHNGNQSLSSPIIFWTFLLKAANSNAVLAKKCLEILLSVMTGNMELAVMDNAEGS